MSERLLVQVGYLPGDNTPTALLIIDCDNETEADLMTALARSVQNGASVMAHASEVLIGDVAFQFEVLPVADDPEQMRACLYVKRRPSDWTYAVNLQALTDRASAENFRYYHTLRRSYLLTVSVNGVPMPDKLYLVKYLAKYPWRPRTEMPEPLSGEIL